MPLSELYSMSKGRFEPIQQKNNTACSTDASFTPDNDLVELVWENGQIMMQGQSSSKARKNSNSNAYDLPSHIIKSRDRDARNDVGSKIGRSGMIDSMLNDFTLSVPSGELGLSQDDEMVPWLNYHIDDSLEHDYCSDFLTGSSGVTENDLSTSHSFFSTVEKRSSFNQTTKDPHLFSLINGPVLEQGSVLKVSDGESSKRKATNIPTSFPPYKSRILDPTITDTRDLNGIQSSSGPYSNKNMQKQDPVLPNPCSSFINFSHFSRPVAIAKGNMQNISALCCPSIPSLERIERNDKGILATVEHQHATPKTAVEPRPNENSDAIGHVTGSKNDKNQTVTVEPAVASSVCSVTNVDRNSNSLTHDLKRKFRETEDSDYPSDDVEEESIGGKKAAPARGSSGSKRSRAAEVHNLSERRRRDRINEKMRALQELIPNCNKVDKASMLDEAIDYLKTLQLQVQIMSMGAAGMYMQPMMLPAGMQHMHASHMPHFSPMSVGLGMGFGMGMVDAHSGSPGYPVMPMHHMSGPHFRGQPVSGHPNLHGAAGSNPLGLSIQGISMAMQHSSVTPPSAGPDMAIGMSASRGPVLNPNSVQASCSKEPTHNPTLQVMQNANASSLINQMSSPAQGKEADFERGAHISLVSEGDIVL